MIIISLIGTIIGVILGGIVLFAGRKTAWIALGIVAAATTANLLAVFVANVDSGWDLIDAQAWNLIAIALVVGAIGIVVGRMRPHIGVLLIGFLAGLNAAVWIYDVIIFLVTDLAEQSEQAAVTLVLLILLVFGLFGVWLVRAHQDEALILITMLVGAQMIQDALGLSQTSSWTAIIMLTLTLAGVLVQYAVYLREIKQLQVEIEPHPSSVAYFQDLELNL